MENDAFAATRIDEESGKPEGFAHLEPGRLLCQRSEGDCLDGQTDLPCHTGFNHFGAVLQHKIEGRDSSGRVTQGACLGDTGGQINTVH